MPNRVRILAVSESDRAVLQRRVRDRGAPAREVQRARIVLLSGEGLTGPQIAKRVGCSEPTVVLWRNRIAGEGVAGLDDRPRQPPPRSVMTDEVRDEILTATLTRPPAELGIRGRDTARQQPFVQLHRSRPEARPLLDPVFRIVWSLILGRACFEASSPTRRDAHSGRFQS